MIKAIAAVLVSALFPGFAAAQLSVELDLDGVVGNGPDVNCADVSDYINVDIWITGTPLSLLSASVSICNNDGSLEFQGYQDAIGSPWTITPPQFGPCLVIQATDFTFSAPKTVPFLYGTATYHAAADGTLGELTVDDNNSGWFSANGGGTGFFTNNIGVLFLIGGCDTATEESSWGAVKGLFR